MMRLVAMAIALAAFSGSALGRPAAIVSATLPERATAFATLAECERSLDPGGSARQATAAAEQDGARGSRFNRAQGNRSHCEVIDGEPLVVVTPRAS
jgi:hypothetical protein